MLDKISKRLQSILDFQEAHGYSPTIDTLSRKWGLGYNGANRAVHRMINMGFITHEKNHVRDMQVTEAGKEYLNDNG